MVGGTYRASAGQVNASVKLHCSSARVQSLQPRTAEAPVAPLWLVQQTTKHRKVTRGQLHSSVSAAMSRFQCASFNAANAGSGRFWTKKLKQIV